MSKSQLKSGAAAVAAAAITAAAPAAPLEIFAPGKWTDMSGRTWDFTAEQVREIAEGYDPALFAAPLVIGHPKLDDPAWGWAASLKVDETSGKLIAEAEKVAPEFAAAVSEGRYRKISAAFYGPDHPGNPKPGQFYLRHIGFLGGVAPAVKGLAPAAFAEGDEFIEFALDAEDMRTISWLASTFARMARGFRDFLIEREGQEVANRVMPDWEAEAPVRIAAELGLKAREAEKTEAKPGFAAPNPVEGDQPSDDDKAARDRADALARREADLAEREASFAAAQEKREADADAAFCDGLIRAGRLAPGLKPQIMAFAAALKADGEAICFAQGQEALPPRDAFRAFLDTHLGQTVHFGEAAPASQAEFAATRDSAAIAAEITSEITRAAQAGRSITAAQAAANLRTANRS